jgi:hypothetical protein
LVGHRYPKHVAVVLRLLEKYLGQGHVAIADAYFASLATVLALLERGTWFIGMLKTASSGFPKAFLHKDAWEAGEEPKRGDTRHVMAEVQVDKTKYKVYGHAWNEPGTDGVPKKVLISSCGDTLPDPPRLFTTVFAMCIVDAYKYFYLCNQVDRHKTIPDWIDQASAVLLTNRRAGCPDLTREQYVLRKRSNSALPAVVQPLYLAFVVRGVAVIVFRGTRQIPCSVVINK